MRSRRGGERAMKGCYSLLDLLIASFGSALLAQMIQDWWRKRR
jgi:hypothetical protein